MLQELQFTIRPKYTIMSSDQIEYLYNRALDILEQVGVQVLHSEALDLLKQAGSFVNSNRVARIKPHTVEQAIQTVPKKLTIYDRNGTPAMELGGPNTGGLNTYYGTGSDLRQHYDLNTGEIRLTRSEDIANMSRVVDALPNMDFVMSYGIPSDCDLEKVYQTEFVQMVSNTTKPIIFTSDNYDVSCQILEMAAIVAGGRPTLEEKPFVLNYSQPTSPLKHSEDAFGKLMACAEYGIPVCYPPGLMPGASAPVTLAGAIIQSLAEGLTALVVLQLKRQGSSIVLCGAHGCMDMRTMINVYAAPERLMTQAALAGVYQYFGIPTWGMSGISDAILLDEQAGVEYGVSSLWAALSGVNLAHDVGYLGSGMVGDLRAIVLNDEINSYVRHMLCKGIKVDNEHLAMETIQRVGHSSNFLDDPHTFQHFRSSLWSPELFNRSDIQRWEEKGSISIKKQLGEKVRQILNEHSPQPLKPEVTEELNRRLTSKNSNP